MLLAAGPAAAQAQNAGMSGKVSTLGVARMALAPQLQPGTPTVGASLGLPAAAQPILGAAPTLTPVTAQPVLNALNSGAAGFTQAKRTDKTADHISSAMFDGVAGQDGTAEMSAADQSHLLKMNEYRGVSGPFYNAFKVARRPSNAYYITEREFVVTKKNGERRVGVFVEEYKKPVLFIHGNPKGLVRITPYHKAGEIDKKTGHWKNPDNVQIKAATAYKAADFREKIADALSYEDNQGLRGTPNAAEERRAQAVSAQLPHGSISWTLAAPPRQNLWKSFKERMTKDILSERASRYSLDDRLGLTTGPMDTSINWSEILPVHLTEKSFIDMFNATHGQHGLFAADAKQAYQDYKQAEYERRLQ